MAKAKAKAQATQRGIARSSALAKGGSKASPGQVVDHVPQTEDGAEDDVVGAFLVGQADRLRPRGL